MSHCSLWIQFRRLSLRGLLTLSVLGWIPSVCVAASLAVVNPGFEDISGESPVNEFTFGPFNGWEIYPQSLPGGGEGPAYFGGTLTPFEPDPIGSPGVFEFFFAGAPEGQRVGIAFSYFGTGGAGEWGLLQTLPDGAEYTLQPDTTYTLRVQIGNIASGMSVGGGPFVLDGFPGYRVDLLAGGVAIGSDLNTLAGTIPEGEFAESTVEVTTGASHPQLDETLGIRLVNLNIADPVYPLSDLEVDFDDVRLDATPVSNPVPALTAQSRVLVVMLLAGMAFVPILAQLDRRRSSDR